MGKLGHPVVSSAAAEIGERPVNFDLVFERIKAMDAVQEQLKNVLKNQLLATQTKLNNLESRVNNSQSSLIEASANFINHYYYLSLDMTVSALRARDLCRLYSGYLAEINDEHEFNFITNFLNENNVRDYVIVGASDEDVEDTWLYTESRHQVTYFNWLQGQPSETSGEDCMWLSPERQMVDWHCGRIRDNSRFLCEIP